MDNIQSKTIALFRYGIIADFVNTIGLRHGVKAKLLQHKCSLSWNIPYSDRNRVARTTIIHWIKRYNDIGRSVEALNPRERSDKNKTRVIDHQTANNLIWLTKNSAVASCNTLLAEMNIQNLVTPGTQLTPPTVYRFLNLNNLTHYLKNRKKQARKTRDNSDNNKLWLRRLVLGRICLNELKKDLDSKMHSADVEALYNCILKSGVRYRNRAIGILSLCKGISRDVISEYLMIPRPTLLLNYRTYQNKGLQPIISDKGKRLLLHKDSQVIDKIFSILHSPPSAYGFNRTSWRQADIKTVMINSGMSVSTQVISKVINDSGYKYRKARTVLTSNDPQYKHKIQQIKGILSNLGPKEKFFSIDEYGPFAVKLQGGRSLVPPGTIKMVPQFQKSKGSIIITAALELSTNQVTHFYSADKNTLEMIKLLDMLVKQYSDEDCIYFSWDAASWHASEQLNMAVDRINAPEYRSKAKTPRVVLVPLPTRAQFLNVIESVFSGMARAIIHNSNYESVAECILAIDRYFAERNEHFQKRPGRAGNKIWRKERVEVSFSESNNCKDPRYR